MEVIRSTPFELNYRFEEVPAKGISVITPFTDFFKNTSEDDDCNVRSCDILSKDCTTKIAKFDIDKYL